MMAKSKWSSDSSAKEILSRIELLKVKPGKTGGVVCSFPDFKTSFDASGFDTYLSLLTELARFNPEVPEMIRAEIVNKAIFKSSDDNKLEVSYVSQLIKNLEKEYLNKDKIEYILIARITITGLDGRKIIKTPNSRICLYKKLPRKFSSHHDINNQILTPNLKDVACSWVAVHVHARCIYSAADTALQELNFWLGIVNIFYNYYYSRVSLTVPEPINKIRKISYYTLHFFDGKSATEIYWYDLNNSISFSPMLLDEKFLKSFSFYRKMLRNITKTRRSNFFIKVLNQYCEALDSSDMNKSFLALWVLLEIITFTGKDNYDVTINRTLVVFEDKFFIAEILNVFRNKRNLAIHTGSSFSDAEHYAFILLRIIHDYIIFIIDAFKTISDEKKLVQVLDLPTDRKELEKIHDQYKEKINEISALKSLLKIEN